MTTSTMPATRAPAQKTPARVDIIGVPMDLGADRRGVDMGPSAIRYARLTRSLGGSASQRSSTTAISPCRCPNRRGARRQEREVSCRSFSPSATNSRVSSKKPSRDGGFPLVLGGDHSIAIGTLAGLNRARGTAPGLIWIDAHGDINTPLTSPSGNVHGMPVSIALEERSISPSRRTVLDRLARRRSRASGVALRELGVRAFSMCGDRSRSAWCASWKKRSSIVRRASPAAFTSASIWTASTRAKHRERERRARRLDLSRSAPRRWRWSPRAAPRLARSDGNQSDFGRA